MLEEDVDLSKVFYPLMLHRPAKTASDGYLHDQKRLPFTEVETAYQLFGFRTNPLTVTLATLQGYCRANNIEIQHGDEARTLLTEIILWQISVLEKTLNLVTCETNQFINLVQGVRPRRRSSNSLCLFLSATEYGSLEEFQANSSLFMLTRWGVQEVITFDFDDQNIQFQTREGIVADYEIEALWFEPRRLNQTLFAQMVDNPAQFVTFLLPWQKTASTPAFQELSKLCWWLNTILSDSNQTHCSIELFTSKQIATINFPPEGVIIQVKGAEVGLLFSSEQNTYLYQVPIVWVAAFILAYAKAEASTALFAGMENRQMYQQVLAILKDITATSVEVHAFLGKLAEFSSILQHFIEERTS